MAILHNRVREYKKPKFKIGKTLHFPPGHLASLFVIIISVGLLVNSSFLSIENKLVDVAGLIHTNLISPTEKLAKGTISTVVNIVNFDRLHTDNVMLKIENKKLSSLVQESRIVKLENSQLKNVLKLAEDAQNINPRARVIFKTSGDDDYLAVIEGGSENGFRKGDIVLSAGHLAGRIVTTGKNYSKVSLINSYNSRIPVTTSTTALKAILVGNADRGGYLVHLYGRQKPIEGELIVTSGDGTYYPKGIPVARVESVSEDNIIVSMLSDISSADFVEILSPDKFLN